MNKDAKYIKCDVEECGAKFLPSDAKREFEYIPGEIGLKRSYFCCPVCGHKYTIDVTDQAMRLMIKNYTLLYKKQERLLKKGAGETRLANNYNKLVELRDIIISRGDELKRKWS